MADQSYVHGHIAHFAINADDVDAARRFYGEVFDWTFEPWGPPGFFHIRTAGSRPRWRSTTSTRSPPR